MQAHPGRSRHPALVRTGWATIAALLGFVVAYLAGHRSADPEWLGRYSLPYLTLLTAVAAAAVAAGLACLPRFQARWNEGLANALLLLISTLAALAGTEALVRVMDPLGISYYEASARYQRDKLADPELGFTHRPSYRATYGGIPSEFNALGLRDGPVTGKATGEFRILALGDSVTFGWGTAQAETFSERLEIGLGRALRRPVVVVNAGVGGYNTVQERGLFRRLSPLIQPDLILLTYVTNDVEAFTKPVDPRAGVSLEGKSPPEVLKALLGRLWVYRLVSHVAWYGGGSSGSTATAEDARRTRGWRDSMDSLRELAEAARAGGTPLVVVFFRRSHEAHSALLDDVAAAVAPGPVIDTAAWHAGRDVADLTISRVDAHPNARGHALLAEGIAAYLLTSGLVAEGGFR